MVMMPYASSSLERSAKCAAVQFTPYNAIHPYLLNVLYNHPLRYPPKSAGSDNSTYKFYLLQGLV